MKAPIWSPDKDKISKTQISEFSRLIEEKYNTELPTYKELHTWSVENSAAFWKELWKFVGLIGQLDEKNILSTPNNLFKSTWFENSKLNFTENLLAEKSNKPAIISYSEGQSRKELSWDCLTAQVCAVAAFLKSSGINPGDRVAAMSANVPEGIVSMLATASIGGIWSSCSPDFGTKGLYDRFGQIEPKILFATTAYNYNGKTFDTSEKINFLTKEIDSISHVVTFPNELGSKVNIVSQNVNLDQIIETNSGSKLEFEKFPFNHPLYILFSSGTTGVPKCIVHGAGGSLIQHLKEHRLHTDIRPEERVFYHTTLGWMMWNWLVSALASKACLILYDGSPTYPSEEVLFEIAEKEKIAVFGTSAKYLSAIEKTGFRPAEKFKLERLRSILSTGSTLLPEQFDFVYKDIKQELCLSSISGGTDIVSCFALGCPNKPVYRGELQALGLGMDVAALSPKGKDVINEPGELVCKNSFPSKPVFFWNDSSGERYKKSYFSKFDNVWTHGDWITVSDTGGAIIHGRSDATLNPGGVRIGTAEIYSVVDNLPEVLESVVIGLVQQGDESIVLFVKLAQNKNLDDELKSKISSQIRAQTSPRHVPKLIFAVKDIPKTRSGKISEIAVKKTVNGIAIDNQEALANPEALDCFREIVKNEL